MKKDTFLPSVVLSLICVIIAGLLAIANEITKEPIEKAKASKTQKSLSSAFGDGEYTESDWNDGTVKKVYIKDDGTVIFEVVTSGYSKNGLDLLIGVGDDGIVGIGVVSLTETKGVGTKIDDKNWLSGFSGKTDGFDDIVAISGATYSSRGVREAAKIAVAAYSAYKGATK